MKLNNLKINLTGDNFEYKPLLNSSKIIKVSDDTHSIVYYESGIPEIDNLFDEKYYFDKYILRLLALNDGIVLHFAKFEGNAKVDAAFIDINRLNISDYNEEPATNLVVLKNDQSSRKFKKNLGAAFGVVGAIIAEVNDSKRKIKTITVSGSRFNLFFNDKDGNQKTITIYSSDEYKHEIRLFLNTYYKSELSEEAKKPIQSDSSCFIATACYKDLYSEEVIFFRWYRDNVLNNSSLGKAFVCTYYKLSPLVYKSISNNDSLSATIKKFLNKIYGTLTKKYKLENNK